MNFTTLIMLIFTAILAIGLVLKGLILAMYLQKTGRIKFTVVHNQAILIRKFIRTRTMLLKRRKNTVVHNWLTASHLLYPFVFFPI